MTTETLPQIIKDATTDQLEDILVETLRELKIRLDDRHLRSVLRREYDPVLELEVECDECGHLDKVEVALA